MLEVMGKSILDFLALFWLCLCLIGHLFVFIGRMLWQQLNKTFLLYAVLTLLITLLCLYNLQLIKEKQEVRIISENRIDKSINFQNQFLLSLEEKQLKEQIDYYQKLIDEGIMSRDIYLNLALLYRANQQEDLANIYFSEARNCDPNSPLFSKK